MPTQEELRREIEQQKSSFVCRTINKTNTNVKLQQSTPIRDNAKALSVVLQRFWFPIPFGQYWNNVIQIDSNSNRKFHALNFVEKEKIKVDEAIVIKKK